MIRSILLAMLVTCQNALVKDDPYQFEQLPEHVLEKEIDRLELRARWVELNEWEKKSLELMRCERLRRDRINALLEESRKEAAE